MRVAAPGRPALGFGMALAMTAQRQTAMTLLEVVIALVVLCTLLLVAMPGFTDWLDRLRMHSQLRSLVHSLHRAAQNARLTGTPTVICGRSSPTQCAGTYDWTAGWLMFANVDNDDPPQVDPGEQVLDTGYSTGNLRISANRPAFVMRGFGLRSTNGTLLVCNSRNSGHAAAVVVSYTGKARIGAAGESAYAAACAEGSR